MAVYLQLKEIREFVPLRYGHWYGGLSADNEAREIFPLRRAHKNDGLSAEKRGSWVCPFKMSSQIWRYLCR